MPAAMLAEPHHRRLDSPHLCGKPRRLLPLRFALPNGRTSRAMSLPLVVVSNSTMRSGSGNGGGFSNSVLTKVTNAVFRPMPRATAAIATERTPHIGQECFYRITVWTHLVWKEFKERKMRVYTSDFRQPPYCALNPSTSGLNLKNFRLITNQ